MSVVLASCDNSTMDIIAERTLPTEVETDFHLRYPYASINDFWDYSDDNLTRISFEGCDGMPGTAIYLKGVWMVTERAYDEETFRKDIPWNVRQTYLRTGVTDEEFLSDGDCIVEIARNGFDQKQYEFHFTTPSVDAMGRVTHLCQNIIISEDGTLLAFDHFPYNRSIRWYDFSDPYNCVAERYPSATFIGAAYPAKNNIFYIKDDGILKSVTTREGRNGHEWQETEYRLAIDTNLPESVELRRKAYEAQHPDLPFYYLSYVENARGEFYRLGFGSDWSGMFHDVEAE